MCDVRAFLDETDITCIKGSGIPFECLDGRQVDLFDLLVLTTAELEDQGVVSGEETFWEDKAFEEDGQPCLAMPTIRDNGKMGQIRTSEQLVLRCVHLPHNVDGEQTNHGRESLRSSTMMMNVSAQPWIFSSQQESGTIERSIWSKERVIGCAWACNLYNSC